LRFAAELCGAAHADAARFHREPRKVAERKILFDRERSPRSCAERIGDETLVVVRVERDGHDGDRDQHERDDRCRDAEQNLDDTHASS